MGRLRTRKFAAAAAAAMLLASSGLSDPTPHWVFDIPAQDLKFALRAATQQAGYALLATTDLLNDKVTRSLTGDFTIEEAVSQLLAGSDLVAEVHDHTVYIRRKNATPPPPSPRVSEDQAIEVTGSRISGVETPSPLAVYSRDQIVTQGYSTLGDFMRSLPSNFVGGQNPGVVAGASGLANQNINSASSVNLRGLGPDATLTLLNGHRLSYGSFTQAVDISTIPLAAVDRVEALTDGASTSYGSDAVAGVVNIILKHDYEGVDTLARMGAATGGGDWQQQYNVVAGKRWGSGGVMATYNFEHDTPITADQRPYTKNIPSKNSLLPPITQHSALLSLHEQLAPNLTFAVDGGYSHRYSPRTIQLSSTITARDFAKDSTFQIAPSLQATLKNWKVGLTGLYGEDRTHSDQQVFINGSRASRSEACYCNNVHAVELSGEGPVIDLPAGPLRLALGLGYRFVGFNQLDPGDAASDIRASQDTVYSFGEASIPIIGRDQDVPFVRRLEVNAAVRYEDYRHLDRIATPKFGLLYTPVEGLGLKATWGRSFKAPQLALQYQQPSVYLYPVSYFGGAGYAGSATALLTSGGNPALKPERAETWTATATLQPPFARRLVIEGSYFHIDYRDRVAQPIPFSEQNIALANNRYAQFVDRLPSAAEIASIISSAGDAFHNYTDQAYESGDVAAVVSDRYINVARQTIEGVDLTAHYTAPVADHIIARLDGLASWLKSRQQIDGTSQTLALAGTFSNPPRFRMRLDAGLDIATLSLTVAINHMSALRDTRTSPNPIIGGQTTGDLAVRYRTPSSAGLLAGFDVLFSVSNILNDKPSYAAPVVPYVASYDSTNQSAVGRFVSLSIAKHW